VARLADLALAAFRGAALPVRLVAFLVVFFAAFLVERAAAAFFVPFLPAFLVAFREADFLVARAAFLVDFLAAFLDFPARDFFPAFFVAFLVAMRFSFSDCVLLKASASNIGLYSIKEKQKLERKQRQKWPQIFTDKTDKTMSVVSRQ
jgi:hypothetical protein